MKQLIAGILLLFLASCAQVVPLTGGATDATPPIAKEELPVNGSVNFNGNKITITFNEYIQLKDVFNQLIITPQLKEQPDVNADGKTLSIKFNEQLKENTTYILFFGNSITDITEGNVLKDYSFSFSTGPIIDTLQLSGTVTDAYSGKMIKDSWVMLYENNTDSIVFRSKPDYLTRTNDLGFYTLKGLKPGNYKIVSLSDNNKNLLYDNGELFGYLPGTISVPGDSAIALTMFKEKPSKVFISKTDHLVPEKATVVFNTPINQLNKVTAVLQDGTTTGNYIYKLNRSKDSLRIYFTKLEADSIYIKVNFNNNNLDSTLITFLSMEQLKKQFERKRLPFELTSVHNPGATLPYSLKQYKLVSTFLVNDIDKNKLILTENGTTLGSPDVSVVQSAEDSIDIFYKWKSASNYEIVLLKDFAKDKFERGNDSIVFKFKTTEKSDYGTLNLILLNPEKINYVVQLLNPSNKVIYEKYADASALSDKNAFEMKFFDVIPDTYTIRLVLDTNNDKAFTAGDYLNKIQPEKIMMYAQPIKIISDWDIEQKWELGQ
ncbi:MAG TPA: Ig-like domain-containing protein [Bacteroidia bacterium]